MASDLDQAYDVCQQITRSRATNFYYAFRTLPARRRRAICAAYAFCRICDDIADGDHALEHKLRLISDTRRLLREGMDGETSEPVFLALKDATSAFQIPTLHFEEVIDGVEMDLTRTRYQSFSELEDYCYKVASTVGLISIQVFGYEDAAAKEYAVDFGLGMQLTNIMRDIREDSRRGRIYIPQDEIDSFGYSEQELMDGVINDAFHRLMRSQVARARRYLDSGGRLIPLLTPQSRACPAVLLALYSKLLDRIETSSFDVFSRRIGLSTTEKLWLMARLWATSLIPTTYPSRR